MSDIVVARNCCMARVSVRLGLYIWLGLWLSLTLSKT